MPVKNNTRTYLLLLLAVVGQQTALLAQDATLASAPEPRWEMLINVTNAVSRAAGNTTRTVLDDPYAFAMKRVNAAETAAWRMGMNGFRRGTNDVLIDGGTRVSEEWEYSLILGREFRRNLGHGITLTYGLDAQASLRKGSVVTEQIDLIGNISTTEVSDEDFGGAAGPFLGFQWQFHPNLCLYTEANAYYRMGRLYRTLSGNGSTVVLEDRVHESLMPMMPGSLFLVIQF
jgi:hypothetical protein